MQQEDDLRGLAKVMEFMRAISIVFIIVHVYWFCYRSFVDMGIDIGVLDKILLNFQRTAGLFSNLLVTKVFAFIFLGLSCLGTKGVKNQKMTWRKIYAAFLSGLVLFFMNWWMLDLPFSPTVNAAAYTLTLTAGYILLLMSGVWISRMLKHNLMEDVFNTANESFMQETRLMKNEYSVNLPTKFVYQGREWDGWINVVNPFRASIVLGTPGSGKSYAVVNNYIKQQIEKSFAMYIYDYKFPDLSEIAYNQPPLQSHQPQIHGGHIGRLRVSLHDNAQLEQDLDTEARRLFRRITDHPAGRNYLVFAHLQRRKVLHVPSCH